MRQELPKHRPAALLLIRDVHHRLGLIRVGQQAWAGGESSPRHAAPRDGPDRNQAHGGPCAEDLAKRGQFRVWDGPLLHVPAPAAGDVLDAVARQAVDGARRVGHDECRAAVVVVVVAVARSAW